MDINIKEIARLAGVSIATVSRALNNNGSVKPETRRKIQRIARELNYKPNPIARGLSSKKTDTVGVILPEMVDEFFTEIIRGIDEEAHRTNNFVIVSSSYSQRNVVETLLEFMSSGRVDGLILLVPQIHNDINELIHKSKRPIVLLNNNFNDNGFVSFNINNFQGAYNVVEHLIGHGYQNIAMIQGPEGNIDADERYRGYVNALKNHNLPVQNSLIIPGEFNIKSGYYGFIRLMSQPKKPDAIFTANDMMAVGVYEASRTSNIKIPQDVAVVGFDDIFLSRLLSPRLTTIHVPIVELGRKSMRYLLKMINNQVDPKKSYCEELTTGLVIGGSCGCKNSTMPTLF